MKRLLLLWLLLACLSASAQKYEPTWASLDKRKIPEWFRHDKFGIFIHWGLYAVPSYAPVIPNSGYSYAEWYWQRIRKENGKSPSREDSLFLDFHAANYGKNFAYQQFEPMFRAELFDPAQWVAVFKRSGAKYVVLTSKHHEGYCLWNSAEADKTWGRPWNAVTGKPGRDLLGDLSKAVRDSGIRMGYYYSMYEWFNPLWLGNQERYVAEHMIPQFKDLVTRYKPSIIFSDGDWDLSDTAWKSRELLAWLFNESPVAGEVVVNDRWGNGSKGHPALYTTSEYGSGMNPAVVWEESQGIGHSYGYNRNEKLEDYKSSHDLILMLADIVSRGGNLLLDIGPTADGRIPVIMQQRLTDMGAWLEKNGEAIYGTTAYKQYYQWSPGQLPKKDGKASMAGYSVAALTKPSATAAHIEAFFTAKGKDLYAILPVYTPKFILRDLRLPAGANVSVLGSAKKIAFTNSGSDTVIDLSSLPGEIPSELLVIKIKNGLTGK